MNHTLPIRQEEELQYVEHKFVILAYFKEVQEDGVQHPEGYLRVSTDVHELTGANVIPIQLLFSRFVKYRDSENSALVIPYFKKWLFGNECSIKPKRI